MTAEARRLTDLFNYNILYGVEMGVLHTTVMIAASTARSTYPTCIF